MAPRRWPGATAVLVDRLAPRRVVRPDRRPRDGNVGVRVDRRSTPTDGSATTREPAGSARVWISGTVELFDSRRRPGGSGRPDPPAEPAIRQTAVNLAPQPARLPPVARTVDSGPVAYDNTSIPRTGSESVS